jgi:hypothetical protein
MQVIFLIKSVSAHAWNDFNETETQLQHQVVDETIQSITINDRFNKKHHKLARGSSFFIGN